MERLDKIRLSRRDMLKLSAGGAGMFAIGAGGFAVPGGIAKGGGGGGGGSLYIEAFPTSPLILNPFNDLLNIPTAMPASDPDDVGLPRRCPRQVKQDSIGESPNKRLLQQVRDDARHAPALPGRRCPRRPTSG